MDSLADLKTHPVPGVLTTSYEVRVSVPTTHVARPALGQGIHAFALTTFELQQSALFARSIVVDEIQKDRVIINFTVAEPYLKRFYENLKMAEGTHIIKEQ